MYCKYNIRWFLLCEVACIPLILEICYLTYINIISFWFSFCKFLLNNNYIICVLPPSSALINFRSRLNSLNMPDRVNCLSFARRRQAAKLIIRGGVRDPLRFETPAKAQKGASRRDWQPHWRPGASPVVKNDRRPREKWAAAQNTAICFVDDRVGTVMGDSQIKKRAMQGAEDLLLKHNMKKKMCIYTFKKLTSNIF